MGLPISPILADIVMEYVLDKALDSLHYKVKVCKKYVDDLFLIVPRDMLNVTLEKFNAVHPNIQFTHEMERDNMLPFLDVLVAHNSNGTLLFDWYAKPTSSGRLLNFFSNHPLSQKLNVMDNLINRIFSISSQQYHFKNKQVIRDILVSNGYPPEFNSTENQKVLLLAKFQTPRSTQRFH